MSKYTPKTAMYNEGITRWQYIRTKIKTTKGDMLYEDWCKQLCETVNARGEECYVAYKDTHNGKFCCVVEGTDVGGDYE